MDWSLTLKATINWNAFYGRIHKPVNDVLTELSVSGKNKKWLGPFFETLSDPWRRRSPSVSQGLVSLSWRSGLGLEGLGLGGLCRDPRTGLGLVNIPGYHKDYEQNQQVRVWQC